MVDAAEVCGLDTEASGKDPRNAVLYGVAFSVGERQGVYVPLMQPDLDGVSQEEVRARVESIFRIKTRFVGHKIKFDYLILSSPNLDEALRANAVRDALLSRECPSPKQALQRLQQITEDEVLRTDLTRCARSAFRCAGERLLEGVDHADVLLSIAIGLPDAAVCRRFLLSPEKAIRIRAKLRLRYPALFEWLDRFRRESIARGCAEHDGRRIYLEGLRSSNIEKKNTATSAAIRWLVRY